MKENMQELFLSRQFFVGLDLVWSLGCRSSLCQSEDIDRYGYAHMHKYIKSGTDEIWCVTSIVWADTVSVVVQDGVHQLCLGPWG